MNQKYPFIRSRNIFSFGDFWESNFVRKKNTPWTGGAKIPFQWMERWKKAAFQFSLFLLISFLNFPTSYLLVKRAVMGSFLSEIHSNMMNKTARATFEIPPWRIWLWRILTSQMDVENCALSWASLSSCLFTSYFLWGYTTNSKHVKDLYPAKYKV